MEAWPRNMHTYKDKISSYLHSVQQKVNINMKPTSQFVVGIVLWLLLLVSVQAGSSLQSLDRNERATIGDRKYLWTNGTVYYSFDSSISPRLQYLLQKAMTEWQNETCLQFQPRDQETDYIKFYSYPNEEYCTCDSVGRMGGEQEIKLGYSCQFEGELLHIIGHVIGLWHEQARPDRDTYVQILKENIDEGQENRFEKRNMFTIDYQGISYDYGSIMHLSAIAYSKNGYDTTKTLQGGYAIGQREELSVDDIRKVNTLYHCPSESVKPGKLQVTIINVTVYSLINANPRIEVTAVDSNGDKTAMYMTERKFGRDDTQTQESESMEFPVQEPKDWQFFRIRILGADQLAISKTVHIIPGQYRKSKYCISNNEDCDEYLEYAYKYIEDGNECRRNPCNHGTCTDLFVDYTCNCPTSYYGDHCEHNHCESNPCQNGGICELDSTNSRGYTCQCSNSYYGDQCQHNRCDPNPCQNSGTCQLTSSNSRGYTCSCSPTYRGEQCELYNYCYPNPCQNDGWCSIDSDSLRGYSCDCRYGNYGDQCEYVDFCTSSPCRNLGICTRSYDSYTCSCPSGYHGDQCQYIDACISSPCQNSGTCTRTSNTYTCSCRHGYHGYQCPYIDACISSPCQNSGTCTRTSNTYTCSCRRGYHGNQCQYIDACTSSPCQNSGTCIRSSNSYTCRCASGYIGANCESARGQLHLYVRYGSGLPDKDGWLAGDSDPYVKVVAYDSDGSSVSRKTSYKQGDESPTWNQWLNFGTDTWTSFRVKVYDSDIGSDDSLSSWVSYNLNSFTSRNYVKMNCYSGYIYFDYEFEA